MTDNWWQQGNPPDSFGENYFNTWASQGLTRLALESDKTIHMQVLNGFFLPENLDKLWGAVESLGGRLIQVNRNDDAEAVYRVFVWPDGFMTVSANPTGQHFNLNLHTLDEERVKKLEAFGEYLEKNEAVVCESSVFMIGAGPMGQLRTYNIGAAGVPLERGNYNKDVLGAYDRIAQDVASPTPAGRLGIFTGPPGTGKTYLLRGLIEEVEALFVLMPASLVAALEDPSIVPLLLELKENNPIGWPIVLVLEDADASLVPRMMDNLPTISNMLNATSGMVGDLIDIRIVATTNSKKAEIDEALLRKGRLSGHAKVGKLDPETQIKILRRLTPDDTRIFTPERDATLADVYDKARGLGWQPPTKDGSRGPTAYMMEKNDSVEVAAYSAGRQNIGRKVGF